MQEKDVEIVKEMIRKEKVKRFCKSVLSDKESLDKVLLVWGKFRPPDVKGIIPTLDSLFTFILRSDIDFCLTPNYLEIFKGVRTLRIPRTVLSQDSATMLEEFASLEEDGYQEYFRERRTVGFSMGLSYEFKKFKYNDVLIECIDRMRFVKLLIFKALMVAMTKDDGKRFFECLMCVQAALQNMLLVVPVIRQGRVESKRKWTEADSELDAILALLRREDLFRILYDVRESKRSKG